MTEGSGEGLARARRNSGAGAMDLATPPHTRTIHQPINVYRGSTEELLLRVIPGKQKRDGLRVLS